MAISIKRLILWNVFQITIEKKKLNNCFQLHTSESASGKNLSNQSVPLNWVINDGNGVGGGGGGVGVGSLVGGGGEGVLKNNKRKMD